jgi:hypothetical protein
VSNGQQKHHERDLLRSSVRLTTWRRVACEALCLNAKTHDIRDKTKCRKTIMLTSCRLAGGLLGSSHENKKVDVIEVVVMVVKGEERVGIVRVPRRVYIRPGRARDVAPRSTNGLSAQPQADYI